MRDSLAPHSVGRSVCVACGRSDRKITKEHFWPHWLIDRASPRSVRWRTKRIDARSATVALCEDCNSSFGRELESPVAKIFSDLESAVGLSDFEAELLVRWLWKFEGLSWLQLHSRRTYSPAFTLRDRVLNQLGSIRPHLCLAVSLLDHIDPTYGDAPVGIDSRHHTGAIFVSGVFCRIALMSLLADAAPLVPSQFSVYPFRDISHAEDRHRKLFFPKVGFIDDTEAVGVTRSVSIALANFHEEIAQKYS